MIQPFFFHRQKPENTLIRENPANAPPSGKNILISVFFNLFNKLFSLSKVNMAVCGRQKAPDGCAGLGEGPRGESIFHAAMAPHISG